MGNISNKKKYNMNRELKFRAWDKHEGKWLFGYEYPNLGGFSLIGEVVLFGELAKFSLDYYQHIVFMQYTGLKDKNGKEIYEGDICLIFTDRPEPVIFSDGAFGYKDSTGYFISFAQNHWFKWTNQKSDEIEVIGNIFKTPELLNP